MKTTASLVALALQVDIIGPHDNGIVRRMRFNGKAAA